MVAERVMEVARDAQPLGHAAVFREQRVERPASAVRIRGGDVIMEARILFAGNCLYEVLFSHKGEIAPPEIRKEIIVKLPDHPICKGVKNFNLPGIERYGEPFKVPEPEAVPLEGIYHRPDGKTETARMGLCWTVGKGKVFYFTPGHETYNDYYRPEVRQIFVNAVNWASV